MLSPEAAGVFAHESPRGQYADPVQMACLVEKGKVVGRLPELNISGDFFTILGENYLGAIPDPLLNDNPGELCVARMLDKK